MLSSFIFCLVVQQSANATHDGKLPRIFSHGHHKVITGFPFGLLVILCTVTLPFQQKTLSAMFSFCASSLSSCHFQFNCKFHLYHTGRQHFTLYKIGEIVSGFCSKIKNISILSFWSIHFPHMQPPSEICSLMSNICFCSVKWSREVLICNWAVQHVQRIFLKACGSRRVNCDN